MTAKTSSERLRRLISHGFFAPELPPCFVSEDLAKYRASIWRSIETLPQIRKQPAHQRYVSEPSWFYFPRYGRDDRRHGVLNPIAYLSIAKVISENFVALRKTCRKSKLSASPPVFDWSGVRAVMRSSVDLRDDFRIDLSSRREQFVVADIRAFFHSIYTHSIPWAIHGKAWAKKNRDFRHYGNLLDLFCRNAQDGQTIGLPVGPDTSRLIAEVVASAIDHHLQSELKLTSQDASRYVDDYTLSSDDDSGEALIASLRRAVTHFELELNSDKSEIFSTAHRQGSGWKHVVRAHVPKSHASDNDIHRFLYEVERVRRENPNLNIEKYALQIARGVLIEATNWKSIQSQVVSAYRRNSSLVSILVELCILRQAEESDVDRSKLKGFLMRRLPALAQQNRTGEATWLLFLGIRLGIVLPATCVADFFAVEDPMVALLIAYGKSLNLIKGKINYSFWNQSLSKEGLRSPMWLYAYESVVQSVNPKTSTKFIQDDEYFSLLLAKNIRFLSMNTGFTSLAQTQKQRRGENRRMRRFREDFLVDFEIAIDEFDDDVDEEIEVGGYDF